MAPSETDDAAETAPYAKLTMEPTTPKSPIVFKARGLQLDVCLRVFETEFHVTSGMLKIHSAFFFKFLDSADKQSPTHTAVGRFKYEWDTTVNKDGSWALQLASSIKVSKIKSNEQHSCSQFQVSLTCFLQESENHPEALTGDKAHHIQLFHGFLSALHGESYEINSVFELQELTALADYYCALPAFSNSILRPLLKNPLNIKKDAVAVINVAFKLRHELLFQEAAMFLAGEWHPTGVNSNHKKIITLDARILRAVTASRNATGLMATQALQRLLRIQIQVPYVEQQFRRLEQKADVSLPNVLACIYKRCLQDDGSRKNFIGNILSSLLQNRIRLHDLPGYPGEGEYQNFFLCSLVSEEDIHWDRTQTDF